MTPELERRLDAVRRRALQNAFVTRVGTSLGLALLVAGCAALALRALARVDLPLEIGGAGVLAALALAALGTWLVARRRAPSREHAVGWLDLDSGGRGTLVTELELGDERWHHAVDEALARVRIPAARSARQIASRGLPALVFAALCLLVPIPAPAAESASTAWFENRTEELREKLATLEEEVELDEETAAELAERLDNLEADVENGLPEAMFEGLDDLDARLEELAAAAREDAAQAMDDAARAAELAERDPAAANEELSSLLQELAEAGLDDDLGADLGAALPPELAKALEDALAGEIGELGGLDAEQLKELAMKLGEGLESKLGRLVDAGLLDASELKQGQLAKLADYEPHECDESCEPGGT